MRKNINCAKYKNIYFSEIFIQDKINGKFQTRKTHAYSQIIFTALGIKRHLSQRALYLKSLFVIVLSVFTILVGVGFLVLLVLGDEVVHVGLCLSELHLVHSLTREPVQECLATEHGGELLANSLEQLLNSRRVADECRREFETTWGDVADGGFDIVRYPLDEVGAVLVLDVEHLLVDLFHRHVTSEDGGDGEVSTVTGIDSGHHVFGVKDLLGDLRHGERAVLLGAAGGERCESGHEEVQSWERDHVHCKFSQISVELSFFSS